MNSRTKTIPVLTILALSLPAVSLSQAVPELFEEAAIAGLQVEAPQGGPTLVRSRILEVNQAALQRWGDSESRSLQFNLFPDATLEMENVRRERREGGSGDLWAGVGVDGSGDRALLTLRQGRLTGSVSRSNGEFYRIQARPGGLHLIQHLSYRRSEPFSDAVERPAAARPNQAQKLTGPATKNAAGDPIIDILIAYTPAAMAEVGGLSAIEDLAQFAIDELNQGFSNSGVSLEARLAAAVSFTPTQGEAADGSFLDYVTDQTFNQEVAALHAARDQHGADAVSVWIDGPASNGGVTGIAWIMQQQNLGPRFEDSAFGISEVNFAVGPGFTFAHELGHNLGSSHQRGNGSGGAYPYSWGYQQPNGANDFHTLMSYQCNGDWCASINNWSNPDVNYLGQPTGVAVGQPNSADNRATLNNTGPIAAAWRDEVVQSSAAAKIGIYLGGSWFLDNGNVQWDGCGLEACVGFGLPGYVPVVGDWDGDGKTQIGVYLDGSWFLDDGNGAWDGCAVETCGGFGLPGYAPIVGDWNGDGNTQIGVYLDGNWFLDNGNAQWDGCGVDTCGGFGFSGYDVVVGDWNGDGKAQIGLYRDGSWLLDEGNSLWDGCAVDTCAGFGAPGYAPVVGDWNGDGKTQTGVYLDGSWFLDDGNAQWDGCATETCGGFGLASYQPVVGDWNGDGRSQIGVYLDGGWFLDDGNAEWDGCGVETCGGFGLADYQPVVGDWSGPQ